MKRRALAKLAWSFAGLLVSTAVFGAEGATESQGLWGISSALAMGLGALGGSLGLGIAAYAALGGIARNPSSKDAVFMPMVLVLALVEFQAIMAFIIAVLWFGK
jgi:F-type H+-transporting ATPase subunit c